MCHSQARAQRRQTTYEDYELYIANPTPQAREILISSGKSSVKNSDSSSAVVKEGKEKEPTEPSDSTVKTHYTDSTDCLSDSFSTDSDSGSENSPTRFVRMKCD